MVEPQYAALMFSENCTVCGIHDTSMPDPYLRVRLCPPCRNIELISWKVTYGLLRNSIPYSQHTKPARHSRSDNQAYQLRAETEQNERRMKDFYDKGDMDGLVQWARQQHADWYIRAKEGDDLLRYIISSAEQYSRLLEDMKTERRKQIYEGLKAKGWKERDFNFWRRSLHTIKKWRSLVEIPEPLTEQTWTDMLPTLQGLLERNRDWVLEREKRHGWDQRRFKVEELLIAFRRDTNPYRPIVDVLQQPSVRTGLLDDVEKALAFQAPFPDTWTIAHWCSLTSLYRSAGSLENVVKLFDGKRDTITEKISKWRAEAEEQLVQQYTSSFPGTTHSLLNTCVIVRGSTSPTERLPDNVRFLLRADTVFKCDPTQMYYGHGRPGKSYHFPNIPGLQHYPIFNEIPLWTEYYVGLDKRTLQPYVRHCLKEAIVKALLRELDMPDAAHIELEYMGKVFVCGRCARGEAMEWNEIVEHYYLMNKEWVGGRFAPDVFKTKHPVVFKHNTHDLELSASAEPRVHISNQTCVPPSLTMGCLICHWIKNFRDCRFDSMDNVREHMLRVHDATKPVEGLHFVTEACLSDMLKATGSQLDDKKGWEEKWDSYHGA
ncbi:Putative protein TIC 214 N-terminal part [Rhizoctonia solani]|uniref:Uncharacterized protein n=1 Tax=Rhizoctonia solani TaxID=456999 RepID=A0A0K6GDZ3_9AGAM|nr:Putative protein TIC 214 N-terminal part [Rhizoctonia solani]